MSPNLGYFFCQAADTRINSAAAVLGGLVTSMLERQVSVLSKIQAKYEDRLEGPNAWVVLCEIFEAVIQDPSFKESIFVVDALDECLENTTNLLRFIVQTSDRTKWLISSRNEKVIEPELRSIPSSRILSLEHAEYTSKSIEIYITSRIKEVEALEEDEELWRKTLNTLKEKAMGTFLWVSLVVEQLRDAAHWEVEDVLEEVPEGLESLYGLILSQASGRLKRKGQEACQILLSIVTAAERPLHLMELYTFMSYQWVHFTSGVNLQDLKSITKDCGSIFSIRDNIVYFIHQSAKDYIVKEKFSMGLHYQHLKMFQASTAAMSRDLKYDMYNLKSPGIHINEIEPQRPDPMGPIKYCCLFWAQHLLSYYRFAEESVQNPDINAMLYKFLKKTFLSWVESLALMRSLPLALDIFQKLKYLIDRSTQTSESENNDSQATNQLSQGKELHIFINDGYSLLLHSRYAVMEWPLQLYFSGLAFEPKDSVIRHTFEEAVRVHWGPAPTILNTTHNQSSVLLQKLIVKSSRKERDFLEKLLFSPDSTLIYTSSLDTITAHRTDTGDLYAEFHIGPGARFAIQPKSNDLIFVDHRGNVEVWNVKDKRRIQEYTLKSRDHDQPVYVVALSPNGDLVASVDDRGICDQQVVRLWNIEKREFFSEVVGYSDILAFSPQWEESLLMALVPNVHAFEIEIRRVDVNHHQKDDKESDFAFSSIVISPDSRFVAAFNYISRGISIWSGNTGRRLHVLQTEDSEYPNECDLAFSPNSELLARGVFRITIWNVSTGETVCALNFSENLMEEISAICFSIGSDYVGAAGYCTGEIWRIDTSQLVDTFGVSDFMDPTSIAISPDLTHVAALCSKRGEESWILQISQRHSYNFIFRKGRDWNAKIAFSADSTKLVFIAENRVEILEVATGTCLQQFDLMNIGYLAMFDQAKDLISTGSSTICKNEWNIWEQLPTACYFYIYKKDITSDDSEGG
ncbi:quinon protein alcohol dehydrogenase-like superfamily [Trichoderma chlorosporum]